MSSAEPPYIFKTHVNSFHYLYGDAEYLYSLAAKPGFRGFQAVMLGRTAVVLFILSAEGLINRALGAFLPERLREFILEREERLSVEEKWQLLPLLAGANPDSHLDRSRYPWSHFAELVRVRNEYVHPKHERTAYYRVVTSRQWVPLSWKDIPPDLGVQEKDVVYRQTRIPKDPYAIRSVHVGQVKTIIDDTIAELDRLIGGKLTANGWLRSDQMKLVYPPGASITDLDLGPDPSRRG